MKYLILLIVVLTGCESGQAEPWKWKNNCEKLTQEDCIIIYVPEGKALDTINYVWGPSDE